MSVIGLFVSDLHPYHRVVSDDTHRSVLGVPIYGLRDLPLTQRLLY